MKIKNSIYKLFLILTAIAAPALPLLASIDDLGVLDSNKNPRLKAVRSDVTQSIYIIKSGRPSEELPELRFYKYEIKKGENFWDILSKSSLDMDTIMSVNSLSSPKDAAPGKTLYIPNMRGIIMSGKNRQELFAAIQSSGIKEEYIFKVNKSRVMDKEYIFIPCGKLSTVERSLFLGTGFIFPLKEGRRTSGFGSRKNPFNSRHSEFHTGIDIACSMKSEVHAARAGQVVFTGYNGGYGLLVIVKHEHNYSSYYGHLSKVLVRQGDKVEAGQVIALSGNSGRTTGPHLHFETRNGSRPFNPGVLIKKG